ncbi:MAG: 23S rRNA (uracil(1939)-C(5))-methyltransferase RlmD [Coriobacteriia bacterium]|nr:23S rRNA (uracil(1939)-C(5))-methyltransferase RlmD [Coriobacteriia bacterium]
MNTEIVRIQRLGAGADSVAGLSDGKTVFIPFGCPDDEVEIKIIEDRGNYARGEIVRIITPSPMRVSPSCPYFGTCGGCEWQHIDYADQLISKRNIVVDALSRIGKIENADALVLDCVPSKNQYNYRNKIELEARMNNGRFELGFHKRGTHQLIEVDSCALFTKKFQKAPKALRGALSYLVGNQDYAIERIGIRAATFTSDVEIALYTAPGPFPRAMVAKMLKQAMPQATSIVRVLLKDKAETRTVSKVEVLLGKGRLEEMIGDISYGISAPSFWQVNTRGAAVLVDSALEFLEPDETDTVVDLYSGVGTFTLPLAKSAGEVLAVESYGPAVRDLRRNLDENNLDAEAIGGDAAREISSIDHIDGLIVDPPRAGLDAKVIESLIGRKYLKKLVYVSCDPATLARDLKSLVAGGYSIIEVKPVDLFPQTHHVECVVSMSRSES